MLVLDYSHRWIVLSHQLPAESRFATVLQTLFFDSAALLDPSSESKHEVDLSLKDRPNLLLVVQSAVISVISYYNDSPKAEKLIRPVDGCGGFTCVDALDESRILIGCTSGAVLLWDVLQWSYNIVADSSVHNNRGVFGLRVVRSASKGTRALTVSEGGKACFWSVVEGGGVLTLLREIGETFPVSGCDIGIGDDLEIVAVVSGGLGATKQVVVWDPNKDEKKCYEISPYNFERVRLFARSTRPLQIFGMSSADSRVVLTKLSDSSKGAKLLAIDGKDLDPSGGRLLSLDVHPYKQNLVFLSTPDKLLKLDLMSVVMPRAYSRPGFETPLQPRQVGTFLSPQGEILKMAPGPPTDGLENSKFVFYVSGQDVCCVTFAIKDPKRLKIESVVSRRSGVIPDTIPSSSILSSSYDGRYFALRCEQTGNTGVWGLQSQGEGAPLGPVFSAEKLFLDQTLSLVWNAHENLYPPSHPHIYIRCAVLRNVGKPASLLNVQVYDCSHNGFACISNVAVKYFSLI